MNAQAAPSDPPDHTAWSQAALRRQVERLEQLSELGLELAQAIKNQITDDPAKRAAPETIATAFSRVARAIRMTALLQSRLIKDMDDARRREAFDQDCRRIRAAARGEPQDDEPQTPADAYKARVERIVERQAKTEGREEADVERLMLDASERLDDEDLYGDVLTRPVGELVALICRDLGLNPDWAHMAEEAWAQEEIRLEPTGSPFQTLELVRPLPFAAANGRGGPSADPGVRPGEERMVVGATPIHPQFNRSSTQSPPPALSTIGSAADGPPPPRAGEAARSIVVTAPHA